MAALRLTGNLLPTAWFDTITLESGKPDLAAIIILSEIIWWYRPTEIRSEETGALEGYKKKFAADYLQMSYGALEEKFGIKRDSLRRAFQRLEDLGAVKRIFRDIEAANGNVIRNAMFVQIFPECIYKISSFGEGIAVSAGTYQQICWDVSANLLARTSKFAGYTDQSTKTTTESQDLSSKKTSFFRESLPPADSVKKEGKRKKKEPHPDFEKFKEAYFNLCDDLGSVRVFNGREGKAINDLINYLTSYCERADGAYTPLSVFVFLLQLHTNGKLAGDKWRAARFKPSDILSDLQARLKIVFADSTTNFDSVKNYFGK